MTFYRDIEDVVEALVKAKREGVKVNLLIGAGCSVTADIPAAQGILDEIKTLYPRDYARAEPKDYATCMSKLTTRERKALITGFVKNAKLNWTHITIAHLMKIGYVNRVLTTNFDNLILRACALLDEYPSIYDLASSKDFRSELLLEDNSVFHLHGQHSGFILCNTEDELKDQYNNLEPIFNHLKQNSLWLIVGYSGLNDSVFNLLSQEKTFEHRLFWVGYNDSPPADHIQRELLGEKKYAFYVAGYDSDNFFVSLARRLKNFPPEFVKRPFSHLSNLLDHVQHFKLPMQETDFDLQDLNASTRLIVREAVRRIENDNVLMATHYLNVGLLKEFNELLYKCTESERQIILQKYGEVVMGTIRLLIQDAKRYKYIIEDTPDDYDAFIAYAAINYKIGMLLWSKESIDYFKTADEAYQQASSITNSSADELISWAECLISHTKFLWQEDIEACIQMALKAKEKLETARKLDDSNIDIIRSLISSYTGLFELFETKGEHDKKYEYNRIIIEYCKDVNAFVEKDSELLRLLGFALINKGTFEYIDFKNDKVAIDCFFDSFKNLQKAREMSPLPTDIEFLCRCLDKIIHVTGNENDTTVRAIYETLVSTVEFELQVVDGYEEDSLAYQEVKPGIEMLNSLSFGLIERRVFEISYGLLHVYLTARPNDSFPNATLGMWYLQNDNVECKIAWETGYANYEKAISIASLEQNPLLDALIQKSRLEYAKFHFHRLKDADQAVSFLTEAIEKGSLPNFEGFFIETKGLFAEIKEYKSNQLDEVASSEVQKED